MSVLSQRRLEIELSLQPDPLRVREDGNWIHVGTMGLSKRYPRYNIGFTHPVVEKSRFEREHFELGKQRGWAIIFYSGGTPADYFAGWMRDAEGTEAAQLVDRLNALIQERVAQGKSIGSEGDVHVLTFHQGAEYAPDSPWGIETLRLSREGELEYERRRAGKVLQTAHGHVDAERVVSLMSALARTSFPTAPQAFFPPGASVCTLITEPPFRRMDIELHSGLKMEGYGDILEALSALCASFRDSNAPPLVEWRFTSMV
jgi:hypothetical protein